MATYKVLQDIEAEDKFLGPLTLKQFIFGAIAIVSTYLSFVFITKGIWVASFPFIPVIIVTGFLAFPWGRDQPTEVWLLAKIRFMFKPRKRVWDQVGIQELVVITAPQKVQEYFSDNLSQTEVQGRLRALADTVDSRGWAIKNVSVGASAGLMQNSDRLTEGTSLPSVVDAVDISEVDDIFDNPRANQVSSQLAQSSQSYMANVTENLNDSLKEPSKGSNNSGPAPDFWFMNQASTPSPGMATFGTQTTLPPVADDAALPSTFSTTTQVTDEEDANLLDKIHANRARNAHSFRNHRTVLPESQQNHNKDRAASVTAAPDPATIELARNNDRSVESLARESNQVHQRDIDDEVIISLH